MNYMSEIKTITAEEVKNKLANGETLHLIDVREDDEVAEGMIPEATHIKMGEIPEHLEQLNRETPYIIVCRSGGRSGRVAEYLQNEAYDVTNMVGGMLDWTGETKAKL